MVIITIITIIIIVIIIIIAMTTIMIIINIEFIESTAWDQKAFQAATQPLTTPDGKGFQTLVIIIIIIKFITIIMNIKIITIFNSIIHHHTSTQDN